MTDQSIRASDQERESVVDVLRDAFTEGRLTFDEFEERTAAAYGAKTWAELRVLTADLPAGPPGVTSATTAPLPGRFLPSLARSASSRSLALVSMSPR